MPRRRYPTRAVSAPTHTELTNDLTRMLAEHPEDAGRILEQINSTFISSSPTQEDWYWGGLATGDEEDFFWRRLSALRDGLYPGRTRALRAPFHH